MYKMPKRVLLVVGPGQSNEAGSAEEIEISYGAGAPLRDPVAPNGSTTTRSMWPRLAAMAGDLNVWLGVRNHAVGATTAADSWVGRCRTWSSGMLVARGSYVVSAGNVFKCGIAASTVAQSTTLPAAGTGADGVTWSLARVVTPEDTDGKIYDQSSALFDPNGYLTACASSLSSAVGWGLKVSIISIGQGDKTLSVPRSQYAAALRNAALYLLSAGADKVAIGFTCYGTTAGLTAWYDAELVPGVSDAIASFYGDNRVFLGANLYAQLGALPVAPPNKETPGLKADQLHLNNAAMMLASAAWRDNLVLNGIF